MPRHALKEHLVDCPLPKLGYMSRHGPLNAAAWPFIKQDNKLPGAILRTRAVALQKQGRGMTP